MRTCGFRWRTTAYNGMQCRILKILKIVIRKPIHEQLYYNGFFIEGNVAGCTTLSYYHTGNYCGIVKGKVQKNIRILLREIERRNR